MSSVPVHHRVRVVVAELFWSGLVWRGTTWCVDWAEEWVRFCIVSNYSTCHLSLVKLSVSFARSLGGRGWFALGTGGLLVRSCVCLFACCGDGDETRRAESRRAIALVCPASDTPFVPCRGRSGQSNVNVLCRSITLLVVAGWEFLRLRPPRYNRTLQTRVSQYVGNTLLPA